MLRITNDRASMLSALSKQPQIEIGMNPSVRYPSVGLRMKLMFLFLEASEYAEICIIVNCE